MLKPELEKALNDQLNCEQSAAQEYLAMAAWCEQANYRGFAAYMRNQSDEERTHAMKIYQFLIDRGGTIRLAAIAAPPQDFDSPMSVFKSAWKREQQNTSSINSVYKLAKEHDDYATQSMLHWFIDEQVEEEAWCEEAVGLLEMASGDKRALLLLDRQYGGMAASEGGAA